MKKLVLRCDDFGSASGANRAILELAQTGLTLNVSVLVCGPEARTELEKLAAFAPRVCLGIHAAISAEWNEVKWGPVGKSARATNLVDAEGHFHPGTDQILSLPPEVVEEEIRSQIVEALSWGVPFSYLDEHMGFSWMHDLRSRFKALADEFNLVYRPALSGLPRPEEKSDELVPRWSSQIHAAGEGPHLLVTHPVREDESTRKLSTGSVAPGVAARERDREFTALSSEAWRECLRREEVRLVTYRELA